MFEKFDSAGDDLFSIINNGLIKRGEVHQMRFINVNYFFQIKFITFHIKDFFNNLLIWGSYKIQGVYATDKIIIYRAVSVIKDY
jgi:hypothetical protein